MFHELSFKFELSLLKLTRGNEDGIGRSNAQRESLMKLQERIELLKYHTPNKKILNGTMADEWTAKDGFLSEFRFGIKFLIKQGE